MSGVPSRLGRGGGPAFGEVPRPRDPPSFLVLPLSDWGDVSLFLRNFCDDFRGGGLGGGGGSRGFLSRFLFLSPSRTVELEDEEAMDSLTAASPWSTLAGLPVLPALLRVTGGRETAGLFCRSLRGAATRIGATRTGDCEDIEVGVVSRLYGPGPGDSEYLVEGLPLMALIWLLLPEKTADPGVGGGRSCVARRNGTSTGCRSYSGRRNSRYRSSSGYTVGLDLRISTISAV